MTKKENKEATLEYQQVIMDNSDKIENPTTYVVVREGFRVSDREYNDTDDPIAIEEKNFWTLISNKHSYGELVEIVKYESKKHRVW
jgi:hypothetical protein